MIDSYSFIMSKVYFSWIIIGGGGRCCHDRDRMVIGFTTTFMQPVPIITKVVSSSSAHAEVDSIQLYVIQFVGDLQQVICFLWVLWFPPINWPLQYSWKWR